MLVVESARTRPTAFRARFVIMDRWDDSTRLSTRKVAFPVSPLYALPSFSCRQEQQKSNKRLEVDVEYQNSFPARHECGTTRRPCTPGVQIQVLLSDCQVHGRTVASKLLRYPSIRASFTLQASLVSQSLYTTIGTASSP